VSQSPDRSVLRVLDANANRAREALRVLEDTARFILNRADLCAELKSIRHSLTEILLPYLPDAILQRDTPGDVGTGIKTDAEKTRSDTQAVATAAGKRLGEALRTIEEFLKTVEPGAARKIETLRYKFYDIERRLAIALRPAERFAVVRLYVLITESACRHPWLQTAEQAIDGGADCLQLREKELPGGELLVRARKLADLCRRRGVLFIVNDRADIAAACDADGVHLGQEDLPPAEARRILGQNKIIGVSTHDLDQARRATTDGADYIGVGPIFKSPTKPRAFLPGLEYAAAVAADTAISVPKIGIAGIGPENIKQVLATGIRAVAVTSAVTKADDVQAAARQVIKEMLNAE
jgi:thiamine-phosphate pyrophosphorylase